MEDLLKSKLKAAMEFKKITSDINELSIKIDYNKVNLLIEERQKIIDRINVVNDRIIEEKNSNNRIESEDIKKLNKEIQKVFVEVHKADNIIRKNINTELKIVKEKLNYPEAYIKSVNIKI